MSPKPGRTVFGVGSPPIYEKGKQRLIYVPKAWEDRVRSWVATYQRVRALLDKIAHDCVRRLKERKE